MSAAAPTADRAAQPFNPRVVLGLLLFGALAFIAMLYFIGAGYTGGSDNNGRAHAASRGLTGYAGLVELLKAEGVEVGISRNPGTMTTDSLLVLTPPQYADAEEISKIIANRRYRGPTILVLPKWNAMPIPKTLPVKHGDGWVLLGDADSPKWPSEMDAPLKIKLSVDKIGKGKEQWSGAGFTGKLPEPDKVQNMDAPAFVPLVGDADGTMLAGYQQDSGYYPVLAHAAGFDAPARATDDDGYDQDGNYVDKDRWGLIVVAEPDLFNNYGMADRQRAELASEIIHAAMEGEDLPVVFDVTLNGLGRTQNLLTLAFSPPFLAATLCLILAMVIVGWRAFLRFGPPVAEARAIAFGKGRLVANSAGFILRTRRLHLLSEPYAELMRRRIAHALGLRRTDDQSIDAALARRKIDGPHFSELAAGLRKAHGAGDILRAAHALKSLERTIGK